MGSNRWIFTLRTPVGLMYPIPINKTNVTLVADFFDGKHNIVLGGSWATHPRLAGRSTLYVQISVLDSTLDIAPNMFFISVNWYQRNYPYVWAGARLVRNN